MSDKKEYKEIRTPELLKSVADETGYDIKEVTKIYNSFVRVIARELKENTILYLNKFGSLRLSQKGLNPLTSNKTGVEVIVPLYNLIRFRAAKYMKKVINNEIPRPEKVVKETTQE